MKERIYLYQFKYTEFTISQRKFQCAKCFWKYVAIKINVLKDHNLYVNWGILYIKKIFIHVKQTLKNYLLRKNYARIVSVCVFFKFNYFPTLRIVYHSSHITTHVVNNYASALYTFSLQPLVYYLVNLFKYMLLHTHTHGSHLLDYKLKYVPIHTLHHRDTVFITENNLISTFNFLLIFSQVTFVHKNPI